ncbi:PTS sugar transporter subunit IIA [Geomonas sp. RF6]|uniref:PTS sugar transporter subunit IIA n=1 Tax=Geomonas sp. RF6 TaxID=2897342 RepID=UPI001E3A1DAE|nr:PTS sugar transporter subunit IIA [Geomonas sp. RF6]UFS68787.1 PTS sugar transporter subunit IIA [Geomonas sp. RF6]
MLISVAEVAALLHTKESTVVKWIKKEKLPATPMNETYVVNRMDLLEWATEHDIKVPPELFTAADADLQFPTLAEALETGGIHRNVPGTDKLSVLREVVSRLNLPPQVDPEFLLQVLLAREALGTTAIGDGIAIPHVRNPILLQGQPAAAVMLNFLENPIDFGALDGKPVEILFLLTSPNVKTHLHLLSRIAYALHNEGFRSALSERSDAAAILAAARSFDQGIKNGKNP